MEWLAAEYKISIADAVWKVPLEIALILLPVRNERLGGSGGPSYSVKASMRARNKAARFLQEHFEIVNKPVTETGWKLGENTYLKI